MGVWGTEPNQGDEPLDMFWRIDVAANAAVALYFEEKDVDSFTRWARVGVLQEALSRGLGIKESVVAKAIKDIDIVTDDDAFVEGWKDPGEFLDDALWFKEQLASLLPSPSSRRRRGRRPQRKGASRLSADQPVIVPPGWPHLNLWELRYARGRRAHKVRR